MRDYLIDTNVLVYALDARSPARQARARAWLEYLAETDAAALSNQALTELANVCLKKMQPQWSTEAISEHLTDLTRAFEVLPVTAVVVIEALRGVSEYRLSFFDAQMWAVARLNGIPALLTQDLSAGSEVGGVTIVDPFTTEVPL